MISAWWGHLQKPLENDLQKLLENAYLNSFTFFWTWYCIFESVQQNLILQCCFCCIFKEWSILSWAVFDVGSWLLFFKTCTLSHTKLFLLQAQYAFLKERIFRCWLNKKVTRKPIISSPYFDFCFVINIMDIKTEHPCIYQRFCLDSSKNCLKLTKAVVLTLS